MAKQLFPECDIVIIKTIQISRKPEDIPVPDTDPPETQTIWRSYVVFMGEALAFDGTKLQDIHVKVPFGSDDQFPWTSDTIETDIEAVATIAKDQVKAIEDDKTAEVVVVKQ